MRKHSMVARLSACLFILAAASGFAHAAEITPPPPPVPQQPAVKPTSWDLFKSGQALAAGNGVPKDTARARQIFEQVLASGDKAAAGAAAVALARLATDELKDPDLATRSLERGIELGDPSAMVIRAQSLARGTLQDRKRAIELYLSAIAATKDNELKASAYFALGQLHLEKPLLSAKIAVHYHMLSAGLGNAWSLFAIAGIYDKGIGLKRDWRKAHAFYDKALAEGDMAEKRAAAFALAQLHLAAHHRSPKRAAEYLEIGRKNGDVWSAFVLAGLYREGSGVRKSPATARRLYVEVRDGPNKAAARAAAFQLGRLYSTGPSRNLQLAKENFAFAAARKDVWSAYFLAELYMRGKPTQANRRKARELLLMVRKSKDPEARAAAAVLLKRVH